MSDIVNIIGWLSCLVMLWHVIDVSSKLKRKNWTCSTYRYVLLLAGYSFIPAGSVGMLLGWEPGAYMVLSGISFYLISNRRRIRRLT